MKKNSKVATTGTTKSKGTEPMPHSAEEVLRLALDAAHMDIFDWDVPHNHITWSRRHDEMWGSKPGEFGGTYEAFAGHVYHEDLPGVKIEVARCIAEITPFIREFRVVLPDGGVRWISARGEFTFDESGQPLRMLGATVDITESKRTEAALRQSEDEYRLLFQNNPQPMLAYDPETLAFLAVNDAALRQYGYSRDEFLAMTIKDIRPPEDVPRLIEELAHLSDGPNEPKIWRHFKKDGEVIFVEINSHLSIFAGKRVRIVLANDVTQRVRAENERRILFEIIQGAITTPNLDEFLKLVHRSIGQIVYAENCFVMLHDPVSDMIHFEFWVDEHDPVPPPGPAGKGFGAYVLLTGQPLLLTEGSKKKIIDAGDAEQIGTSSPSWVGVPLRTPSRTIGVLVLQHYEDEHAYSERDLEFLSSIGDQIALAIERKRAEEALNESEERYRDLVENAVDMIYTQDLEGNYTSINKAAEKLTGYSRNETLTRNIARSVAPEQRETITAQMRAAILAGREATAYEVEIMAKDGRRIAVEVSTRLIYENGVPVGAQGIARDITERKRVTEALKRNERELQELAAQLESERTRLVEAQSLAKLGSWHTDLSTMEVIWSEETHRIFETDPAHFRPDHERFLQFVHPDDREAVDQAFLQSFDQNSASEIEHRVLMADGRIKFVEERWQVLHDEQRKPVRAVGTCMDITARKRANEAVRESEEKYRTILENIEDGYYEVDLAGNYTFVSDSLCRINGYSYEEMLGMNSRKYMDDQNAGIVYQTFNEVYQTGKTLRAFNCEIIKKDGTTRFVEASVSRRDDPTGKPIGFRGIVRDITERKRAEEQLRLHATALESAANAIVITDPDGTIRWVNPAFVDLTGYTPDEVLGRNPRILKSGEMDPALYESLWNTLLSGQAWHGEMINRRKDGTTYIEDQTITPVMDGAGRIVNFIAIKQDVTERTEAEEKLARLSEQHELILSSSAEGILGLDLEGRHTLVNPVAAKMLGYQVEELLGHPSHTAWHHTKADGSPYPGKECAIYAAFSDGSVHRSSSEVFWRKDGTSFPVEYASTPIYERGRITGAVVTFSDITERKQAEDAIRESEIQYRTLFDGMMDGVYRSTHDGRFVEVNDAMVKMFGYSSKEEMRQIDIATDLYFAESDRASHFLDNGIEKTEIFRMRRKDGSEVWVEDHGHYVHNEQGNVIFHEGTLRDITERMHAEEALRVSEERYRELVDNAVDIIYTQDLDGNYTSASKAVEDILGYTADEMTTKSVANVVAPEYIDYARQSIAKLVAGETPAVYDVEVLAKDGHRVSVEINARLIEENGVPVGIQGVARDITGRKHLEDQFRQAQKMEAIGLLAGGVAHDFNNLLTAISGYSDLTLKRMPPDDHFRGNIEEIRKAGKRAAELTGQLLAFSRRQILQPRVHNVNSIITEIDGILRRVIRENIKYVTVLDPELGNIKADPGQIEQVIMNLAVNARDAMPDGGTLTIETQNVLLDEDYARLHIAVPSGQFIRIVVTDTGEGMDEETRRHIFEPFFTTKEVGKGTGLGLSTVHGIIKQSGGEVMVYSEPGYGTTFKIYLPCVDEILEKPRWVDDDEKTFSGTETILLVEDEDVVRRLVSELLTSDGYHVLEADCGKAALSICENHSGEIHLLFTDVIMPGMNGGQLRDRVLELRPDIKVLFMSGYTDDSVVRAGVFSTEAAFIEKPFTPDTVSRKIREVLES